VRTDIAGFFGFTERGPQVDRATDDPDTKLAAAVKLTSWNAFRNVFGGYLKDGYLAYAVRGFFATGGTTCYVVRVGPAQTPATTALLVLPAAVTPQIVTYVRAQTKARQVEITLDSSDVLSPGDLIALNDPFSGECVSVASVIDDQTISVAPTLQAAYRGATPVYRLLGTALATAVAAGVADLAVQDDTVFKPGDLVSIEGGGIREVRVITSKPSAGTLHLGLPLDFAYSAGSPVRKLPAALVATAKSAGAWGNRIGLEIIPLDSGTAATRFSLRVTVDQGDDPLQPVQEEFYPLLSLDRNDPSPEKIYAPDVVSDASEIITLKCSESSSALQLLVRVGPLANGRVQLEGGTDGICRGHVTRDDFQAALNVLGMVDEVAILCCPDAAGPPPNSSIPAGWKLEEIQQSMVEQCSRLRYRVAVLDSPRSVKPAQAKMWPQTLALPVTSSRFAALYYPWIKVQDELRVDGLNRLIPPCGHVAGAYAYTDNQTGVEKAPANVELQFIADVECAVTNDQQAFLNDLGINAIRPIPGRGIRVWGARSLEVDTEWTYIHTRRLVSMIEDSVEKASRWTVFQSNDDDLRRMVTHSLNTFLYSIWLTGGLQGTSPEEGYFVKCDQTNNPQVSIDSGLLICQVGIAVAAPMEFLVFELRRSVAGAQVVEA